MHIIHLHDHLNTQNVVPMDAESFDVAVPFGSGSIVRRKGTDTPIAVHETPEQVEAIVEDALNR